MVLNQVANGERPRACSPLPPIASYRATRQQLGGARHPDMRDSSLRKLLALFRPRARRNACCSRRGAAAGGTKVGVPHLPHVGQHRAHRRLATSASPAALRQTPAAAGRQLRRLHHPGRARSRSHHRRHHDLGRRRAGQRLASRRARRTYAGASGSVSAGVGVGANALVGGSHRSFALQPLSVSAMSVSFGARRRGADTAQRAVIPDAEYADTTSQTFPGRGAARSGAPLIRDRSSSVSEMIPGSAAQPLRYASSPLTPL